MGYAVHSAYERIALTVHIVYRVISMAALLLVIWAFVPRSRTQLK